MTNTSVHFLALLATTILLGLSSAGVALVFRALPWPDRWLQSPHWFWRKFWHCFICAPTRLTVLFLMVAVALRSWWLFAACRDSWDVLFLLGGAWAIGVYFYSFSAPPPPMPTEVVPEVNGSGEEPIPSPPTPVDEEMAKFRRLAKEDPASLIMVASGPTPTATKAKAVEALSKITAPAWWAPAAACAERACGHQAREMRLAGLTVLSTALSSWSNDLAVHKAKEAVRARFLDPDWEVAQVAKAILPP